MKKGLGLAACIVMLFYGKNAFGQNEFQAGYGLFSSSEISNTYSRTAIDQVVNLNSYKAYPSGIGPWVVGFNYSLSKKMAVGVVGVVTSTRTSYYGQKYTDGVPNDSKQTVVFSQYSSLVRVFYYWMNVKNMTIYSSIAGGVGYQSYKNSTERLSTNGLALAYHANLLGVRVGNRLGAFFELGYGYAGVANVGVSLYF